MAIDTALIGASAAASGLYGLWLIERPIGPFRTAAKTLAVAALAVLAYIVGAPVALTAGLTLSALGDAFLAGRTERWLPFGLAAFLAAHIGYIWLFVHDGGGRAILMAEPARMLGVVATLAAGAAMLIWLWPTLGALRTAVALYGLALSAMAAASFTLPLRLWPVMAGAGAFLISDGLLSAQLFKALRARWASYAVWALYYLAQSLIVWAYLS
jgi:uncharacterized membrane protein YhhN